ncbi:MULTISPECIES: type I-E CRISPR-associated endoribonuclease Cas2e [Holzapfeliella]|uniref:DNA polymerase III polC-type n=1 Tax=Holzapfeliella floricola DSM 23037 = JCM 16512 TaxID=1423744 RepID=A0A0R2DHW0_9LACO|nr:type I-E CRISPR-associated endoribonuclease Cas2e [Holzapfeliella floricola]KRN03680.1 CRISPR-associated endoribonuclease Cas2 [Holzapfeliella floricola DSM 23037 = JCM 16512]
MPMTVVTLTKVPASLKGDLTKWMQEIATGVYVGNFNVKVREKLWERITENVSRTGQATMSYARQGEVGYDFKTYHTYREVIDQEGVPLVLIPNSKNAANPEYKFGQSKAAKFHKIHQLSMSKPRTVNTSYTVIDIETDGLDKNNHQIIEIGAVKVSSDNTQDFHALIKHNQDSRLSAKIVELTGITDDELVKYGEPLSEVLSNFSRFVGETVLVGYNVNFDLDFINYNLDKLSYPLITNNRIDLLKLVKREKLFAKNYQLNTILKEYGIDDEAPHRALFDAKLTNQLATKVSGFDRMLNNKR